MVASLARGSAVTPRVRAGVRGHLEPKCARLSLCGPYSGSVVPSALEIT
jgi:hypothetical protein